MTVSELITRLRKEDPDTIVLVPGAGKSFDRMYSVKSKTYYHAYFNPDFFSDAVVEIRLGKDVDGKSRPCVVLR